MTKRANIYQLFIDDYTICFKCYKVKTVVKHDFLNLDYISKETQYNQPLLF